MRPERLHWSLAIGGAAALHLGVLFYFAQAAETVADGGAGRPQAVAGIAEAELFLPSSEEGPPVEEVSEADSAEQAEEVRELEELHQAEPVELASVTQQELLPLAPEEAEAEDAAEVPAEEIAEAAPEEIEATTAQDEVAPLPPVAEPLHSIAEASELAPLPETPLPQARPEEVPQEVLAQYRQQKREEERRIAERERREAAQRERERRLAAERAAERKAVAERRAAERRKAASAGAVAGREGPRDPGPSRRTLSNYNSRVYSHLARHKRFPPGARQNGTVTVRFTLSTSGGAGGVRLVGSSGDPALDQAATAMVTRASPFPPIPSEIGRSSMTFTVPIHFARR